ASGRMDRCSHAAREAAAAAVETLSTQFNRGCPMNAVIEHKKDQLPAQQEPANLLQIIERASKDPTVDMDKLERLMAMHERMVARNAESAFNAAMEACQAEMRPISADATNPQTRSKYATYGKLDKALRPIYTRHGFSISF